MSDVSGKLLSDATSELEGKGLVVATRTELSDDVAEGYVIRQSVNAGRELNKGDTVLLYVASAPSSSDTDNAKNNANNTPAAYTSQGVLYNTLCNEYVTLRSSASMKASEVARIPKYAAVDLIAYVQDSDFMKVGYDGKTGYVMEAFFTAENTANGRYVKYCIARQYANLRSRPGSDNDNNIGTIYTDSPVRCTGRSEYVKDQRYLEVIYRGQTGWVLDDVFSDTMDGHTYKGD